MAKARLDPRAGVGFSLRMGMNTEEMRKALQVTIPGKEATWT